MELYEQFDFRHPATVQVLRGFRTGHLREDLRPVVVAFTDLISDLLSRLPDTPELTVCLRHLLSAKDDAVRAAVYAAEETT